MKSSKRINRIRRHARVRALVKGTAEIPRVSVFRSNQHLFVQVIDDSTGKTLMSASDILKKDTKVAKASKANKSARAEQIAETIAEAAKTSGISKIVFDRGGYRYHGRVKTLAESLRKHGLNF